MIKKITSLLTAILLILWTLNVSSVIAAKESTYFVVTAYYSPLPDQKYYLRGNYKDEIRLNGRGIAGASWEKVFPWMLAAPKTYSFWTVIELDGIGTWVVHDRGWAIVSAWNRGYSYDRIDVWMGYGEEGLKRALTWGKRTVKGRVVKVDKKARWNISLESFDMSTYALNNLTPARSIYAQNIWTGSSKEKVLELQKLLRRKGIYSWDLNGKYSEWMIKDITAFQVSKGIIASENSIWAGYWGPKTRKTVSTLGINDSALVKTNSFEDIADLVEIEEEVEEIPELASNWENLNSVFDKNIGPYSNEEDIKSLQKILTRLEVYDGKIDWNYDSVKDDFIEYQVDKAIVFSKKDTGAWYWGPKTKSQARLDLDVVLAIERQKDLEAEAERKKQEIIKNKREEIKLVAEKRVEMKMNYIWTPRYWQASHGTRDLQIILRNLWYLDTNDTAYFGNKTKEALIEFQMDKNVISSRKEDWAGQFGPKTKEALKEELIEMLIQKELEKNDLVMIYWS